jgi:hypothetical protein
MNPRPFWNIRFERSRDERIALLVLCPLLIAFSMWILRTLNPLVSDDSLKFQRWVFHDVMYTCISFLVLAFAWACFRPRWIERAVESTAKRVRFIICALLFFLFVFCPLVTLIVEIFRRHG